MAQKLTANRLIDGVVLYWRGGDWTESFAEGEVLATKEAADTALAAAQDFIARNLVVGVYLFDLTADQPKKEREIIRAAGPSVRKDLGKQGADNVSL